MISARENFLYCYQGPAKQLQIRGARYVRLAVGDLTRFSSGYVP
jgi:hypothetical protein